MYGNYSNKSKTITERNLNANEFEILKAKTDIFPNSKRLEMVIITTGF